MTMRFYSKAKKLEEEMVIHRCGNPQTLQDDFDLGMHFVALLKSCTRDKDLCRGSALHSEISKSGLPNRNVFVGSALVNMYIKCGDLERAQNVFDELLVQNVVTWNALMSGYCQHGYGKETLNFYNQMLSQGVSPDLVTFTCVLKACGGLNALEKGKEVHTQILNAGLLEKDSIIASALIDMYSACDAINRAQEVFDVLPVQSSISWSTLICCYAQAGCYEEACRCFDQSEACDFSPNHVTFACILKACGNLRNLGKGQEIHTQIAREHGLGENIVVVNALITMYLNCGALQKAQEVLEKLSAPNLVTLTEFIAGFARYGRGVEALLYSARLQASGFAPDLVTYASILKACNVMKALEKGKWVHAQLVKNSNLQKDVIVSSELIDMYTNCGALQSAQRVFDKLAFRDVATWNVLIKGYNQHGRCLEALTCFEKMQQDGFAPSEITYLCILESCGILGMIDKAHSLHAQLVRYSLSGLDVMVANALVKMYMQCGAVSRAWELFNELSVQDVISWNVLISGCVGNGYDNKALQCYEHMRLRGLIPNSITTACILKACGKIGALDKGEEIHAQAAKEGLLNGDNVVTNTLVGMYAKCGALKRAEALVYEQLNLDVIPWISLISACTEDGNYENACAHFEQMQLHGHALDAVTCACMLSACAKMGAAFKGKELHNKVVQHGLSEYGKLVGSALVVMYAKCGMLEESQYVFSKMLSRDVVSWTALIAGYSLHGKDESVSHHFKDMQLEGIQPNSVTFISVLQTFRRSGLVNEGEMFFDMIKKSLQFPPEVEHYICMVDLLVSAGFIEKALVLIKERSDPLVWLTVLDASRKQGSPKLGKWAFENVLY